MTVGRQVGEQAEFTMNNQESLQHGNPPSLSSLQQAQRLPLLQVSGACTDADCERDDDAAKEGAEPQAVPAQVAAGGPQP